MADWFQSRARTARFPESFSCPRARAGSKPAFRFRPARGCCAGTLWPAISGVLPRTGCGSIKLRLLRVQRAACWRLIRASPSPGAMFICMASLEQPWFWSSHPICTPGRLFPHCNSPSSTAGSPIQPGACLSAFIGCAKPRPDLSSPGRKVPPNPADFPPCKRNDVRFRLRLAGQIRFENPLS
jgi:hypothetical protein